MATIQLEARQGPGGPKAVVNRDVITTATVSASPGRLHYVTIRGVVRPFERVGVVNGNEVYREQDRY